MNAPKPPGLTQEILDMLIRIKKHLQSNHNIAVNLSDTELFQILASVPRQHDFLLNGMLTYLMALAGPEWARYLEMSDPAGTDLEPVAAMPAAQKPTELRPYFASVMRRT